MSKKIYKYLLMGPKHGWEKDPSGVKQVYGLFRKYISQ